MILIMCIFIEISFLFLVFHLTLQLKNNSRQNNDLLKGLQKISLQLLDNNKQ